jgi:hypothetical protein
MLRHKYLSDTLIFYILFLSLVILAFGVMLGKQCKSWGQVSFVGLEEVRYPYGMING